MSTVKSKNLQVGTDATATNNFTIYQPATPDGTLRIGVGNADSPTEVAQFNSVGIVGDGSQLTGLPAGYTDADALTLFNASGSAPVYACRAWVNFNGTGTVAIRASGNVSSITDNAAGDYTVNFTTAMADANYCSNGMTSGWTLGNGAYVCVAANNTAPAILKTTTQLRFQTFISQTALGDNGDVTMVIFR